MTDVTVQEAILGRKSIRSFLNESVDLQLVEKILNESTRAPSGMNMQPWKVHLVTGDTKAHLTKVAREAAGAEKFSLEYEYVPNPLRDPYKSRRKKVGFDLYEKYGIARDDLEARKEAMLQNYDFFGAPVGLFFVLEGVMAQGSWIDMGMYMQNVMLLARGYGLETCPQQAWCDIGAVVHDVLDIPADDILISGMALGYANPDAAANSLITERAKAAEFVTWHK